MDPGVPVFDKSTPLFEQIYAHLYERILRFDLAPFQMLSEKLIAESLDVSRTPVREALARLAEHRFVDILPQRGTFVSPLRITDLEKSQFMREAIELALLRRVFEHPDRGQAVRELRNEITLQRAFVEMGDQDRFYASDDAFHGLLAKYARLPAVVEEIRRVKMHMDRFRVLVIAGVEDLGEVITQHQDIVDAVETDDAYEAERLLLRHLRRIFAYVDRAMALHPDYFEGGSRRTSDQGAVAS